MAGLGIDPPVGDAPGMRALAARIGAECDALLDASSVLSDRVGAMTYRCPAGDAFREEVAARHGDLARVVRDLRELQAEVLREARRVEEAQAAWNQLSRTVQGLATEAGHDVTVLQEAVRREVLLL